MVEYMGPKYQRMQDKYLHLCFQFNHCIAVCAFYAKTMEADKLNGTLIQSSLLKTDLQSSMWQLNEM